MHMYFLYILHYSKILHNKQRRVFCWSASLVFQCSDSMHKKSKRTLITLFLTITHGILVTLSVSLLRKPRLYSFARVYQFYLDLNHSVSLSKRLLLYYLPAKIAIFVRDFVFSYSVFQQLCQYYCIVPGTYILQKKIYITRRFIFIYKYIKYIRLYVSYIYYKIKIQLSFS